MMSELPVFLKIFLIPFAYIYGLMIEIRNLCYNLGLFRIYKFEVPVISVGNLTLGGTGKTPFTIFLGEAMKKYFSKIAIVSRGYGRTSKGLQVVSNGDEILLDAESAGDEPLLIASRLPGSIVIVSDDRAKGIELALNKFNPDLVILDDAFQHRRVFRDVNILLVNSAEKFAGNFPLPAGSLREFRKNFNRADLIVVTNANQGNSTFGFHNKPVFVSRSKADDLVDLKLETVGNLSGLAEDKVVAFAGIAHPQRFLDELEKASVQVMYFQHLSDHYKFKKEDIKDFVKIAKRYLCNRLLCTEKDLVKIKHINSSERIISEAKMNLSAVRLRLEITNHQELVKFILDRLDKQL